MINPRSCNGQRVIVGGQSVCLCSACVCIFSLLTWLPWHCVYSMDSLLIVPDFYVKDSLSKEACLHYLYSGKRLGSENRHRVLISAEGRWCIVLDQSNYGQGRSLEGRALKPSCLVHLPVWQPDYTMCRSKPIAFLTMCVIDLLLHAHPLAMHSVWTRNDSITRLKNIKNV